MTSRPSRRLLVFAAGGAFLVLFFLYAFWPRAVAVDLAAVETRLMRVMIEEEAKTRVRDAYVVSMPVAGRLLRVEVEAGDAVKENETVIARIAPAQPNVLDVRTEEQARAAVAAAEAALSLADADIEMASADEAYRRVEYDRARDLREFDGVSGSELDQAKRAWRAAAAALDRARAAEQMREAELANARAMLMNFTEEETLEAAERADDTVELRAPISGRVLRVIQESEAVLPAGASVLELGDPHNDLEIVAELLSTDAVQVDAGDPVIIDKWGGGAPLAGVVERVEPWGFTKYSALGVEEQRVNAIIEFDGDSAAHAALGHGYRAVVKIIVWEDPNALVLPANALFRSDGAWAVFTASGGRAHLTPVEIGHNNGAEAEVLSGLDPGDIVILYPGNRIADGLRIKRREEG